MKFLLRYVFFSNDATSKSLMPTDLLSDRTFIRIKVLVKIKLTNEHLIYNSSVPLSVGNSYATYRRTRPFGTYRHSVNYCKFNGFSNLL